MLLPKKLYRFSVSNNKEKNPTSADQCGNSSGDLTTSNDSSRDRSPKRITRLELVVFSLSLPLFRSRARFHDRGRRESTAFPFAVDRACDTTDPCRATSSCRNGSISWSTRGDEVSIRWPMFFVFEFLRAARSFAAKTFIPRPG